MNAIRIERPLTERNPDDELSEHDRQMAGRLAKELHVVVDMLLNARHYRDLVAIGERFEKLDQLVDGK